MDAAGTRADGAAGAATKVLVAEDFEGYGSDGQVASVWYRPPHGSTTDQGLSKTYKGSGKQSLRFGYTTTTEPDHQYSTVCRVGSWHLGGTNAFRFWMKPDGSGRKMQLVINVPTKSGANIHDLWVFDYVPAKGDSSERIVTVPFAALAHETRFADSKDTNPVFSAAHIIEFAINIGSRSDPPGKGEYYFDDLQAVLLAP
jgi:hypothetical protein